MARNAYSVGDLIYLAIPENGRVTIRPMLLVQLVSVSKDGELWKVCTPEMGDVFEHFISYVDDLEELGPERIINNYYSNMPNGDAPG